MAFFHKKSPWEIEWADLAKREAKFAAKRREGPTSVLVQKLDRFVPDKLGSLTPPSSKNLSKRCKRLIFLSIS